MAIEGGTPPSAAVGSASDLGDAPAVLRDPRTRNVLGVLAFVVLLSAPLAPPAGALRSVQLVTVLLTALVCMYRRRAAERHGWGLVTAGTLGWGASILVSMWGVALGSMRLEALGDVILGLGAILAIAGFSRLLSAGTSRRNLLQALDAIVIASATSVVVAVAISPTIDVVTVERALAMPLMAPTISLVVTSYALTASINQPSRRLPQILTLALLLGFVGDIVRLVQIGEGTPPSHNAYSSLHLTCSLLVLVAALTPDPPRPLDLPVPAGRRFMLAGIVAVAIVAGAVSRFVTGEYQPVAMIAGVIMVLSQTAALLLAMSDLRREATAGARSAEELRRSEQRLHLAIDAAPVGIGVADNDGNFVLANRTLGELVGMDPDQIVGRNWLEFLDNSEDAGLLGPTGEPLRRVKRPDGSERIVEIAAQQYPSADGSRMWLGTGVDVTERLTALHLLEHHATHDELTDLPNRRAFAALLEQHLAGQGDGVLVVCDLDQFKFVNDTLGHNTGDALLRSLADRFLPLEESGCAVARIGGDEFCVLVPSGEDSDALEMVAAVFAEPFDLGENDTLHATASIGGTRIRAGTTAEQLVAEADAAMYRAKASGPGRREMYSAATGASMQEQRRVTAGLHRAIRDNELEVWFQPIADMSTGVVVSQESLLRWRDPQKGLLPPGRFVDIAEQCGLIGGIGSRALDIALDHASSGEWNRCGASVSVNVSALQITDPAFVAIVAGALERSGVDPARLWLEITESALLTDVRAARRNCAGLRELGAHLSIDDFGTGYGSLSYLLEFPVESIKIDRSFVAGLDDATRPHVPGPAGWGTPRDEAIVAALVGLSHSLGLHCVAEGVETSPQLHRLVSLGCTSVQGFLVGEPRPVPAFTPPTLLDLTVARNPLHPSAGSVS